MRTVTLLGILLTSFIFSCDNDEPSDPPADIIPVTDGYQIIHINKVKVSPVAVRILGRSGSPLPNIMVHFEITSGSAVLEQESLLTDPNGVAITNVTFDKGPHVTLTATVEELAKIIKFDFDVSISVASKLVIQKGNQQEGVYGAKLKDPLVVRVTDDFGYPAKDFPVKFRVKTGNGRMENITVRTNQLGDASGVFMLSTNVVVNEVVASVEHDSVTFVSTSVYPVQLHAPVRTKDGITLKWEKSINSTFSRYFIYRTDQYEMGVFPAIKVINSVETLEWTDDTATQGPKYFYKIGVETKSGVWATGEIQEIVNSSSLALNETVHDFVVDESGNKIYMSMPFLDQVHVIDLSSKSVVEKIDIGSVPRGLSFSKDKTHLYIALSGSGDVAALNLATKNIDLIDVEEALGGPKVYYVIEGAPNRLFVSGYTSAGSSVYLSMVKLDQGNEAVRINSNVTGERLKLQADYGKFLYVNDNSNIYKFDISNDVPSVVLQKNFFLTSTVSRDYVLSPDGSMIFLPEGAQISTSTFSTLRNVDGGAHAEVNATGSRIYHITSTECDVYNTVTGILESNFSFRCGEPIMFKISGDEKLIYLYSKDTSKSYLYFLDKE
jgi:DNA-binding beta-propeller fold protein YncE